jgi:hypothetical protein
MIYNFPKYIYSDPVTESDIRLQHNKCYEELNEIFYALVRDEESPERVMEETLDLLHSVETLIKMLRDNYGFTNRQINLIHGDVIYKNGERGYYGEEWEENNVEWFIDECGW